MQSRSEERENPENQDPSQKEAAQLLERIYHLAGGDTHKPVALQSAGQELGLSTKQMMLLSSCLVEQGYLLMREEPGQMALYLTPLGVKKLASSQAHTRR